MTNELTTIPESGAATYRMSTDAACLCGEIVKATAQAIKGKRYVRVEGWQAIAVAHGCTASARDVEAVEGGIRAIGEVRRMDTGAVITTAEGFVGDDEPTWASRPMYARRAMAQTRAISRVCRSAFAHVVVMIDKDLQTTPAEEMPRDAEDWAAEAVKDGLATSTTSTYDANKAATAKKFADDLIVILNTASKAEARQVWTDNWKAPAGKKVSPLAWLELHAPDQFQRVSQAHENAVQ
jgi:hypothetical protein